MPVTTHSLSGGVRPIVHRRVAACTDTEFEAQHHEPGVCQTNGSVSHSVVTEGAV